MKSRRSAALVLAAIVLALFANTPRATAGDRLLQRHRPLVVRWREVEVAETTMVMLVPLGSKDVPPSEATGGELTYPNALGLVPRSPSTSSWRNGCTSRP